MGRLWTQYWQLKKQMATGSEPASVSHVISALDPHVLCCCMAGAGGGGFLYVLTKEPHQMTLVKQILEELQVHASSVKYITCVLCHRLLDCCVRVVMVCLRCLMRSVCRQANYWTKAAKQPIVGQFHCSLEYRI